MSKKFRIKSLSTRWLLAFKMTVYLVYSLLFAGLIYIFFTSDRWLSVIFNSAVYIYFLYRLIKMTTKIYAVEFDDDFLYVLRRKNDLLIPLENIKSVEIKTVGGVYRVNLHYEDILGSYFYFKPSLLYPLNFQAKDELVNVLRKKIDQAKKRKQPLPANALTS